MSISFFRYITSRRAFFSGVPTFFSFVLSKSSHGQLYMNALALFDIYGKYAAGNCHLSAFHVAAYNGGRGLPRLRGISGGLFGLLLC